MKATLSFLTILLFSFQITAQTTNIPDSNFEQILINLGLDSGSPDGVVLTVNIDTLTSLTLPFGSNIANLTGLEDFIALEYFNCDGAFASFSISTLDLSQNTALTYLDCSNNFNAGLSIINLTQNIALTELRCRENQIGSLDLSQNPLLSYLDCFGFNNLIGSGLNLSSNPALTYLNCDFTQIGSLNVTACPLLSYLSCEFAELSTLDVSQCTALSTLNCNDNFLTSLDVTQNAALTFLYCNQYQLASITSLDLTQCPNLEVLECGGVNQISSLDLTQCPNLTWLGCGGNLLTQLDLSQNLGLTWLGCGGNQLTNLDVSLNTALTRISCNYNQLTTLDLSQNAALTRIVCNNNQLTCLNVKNGGNTNIPSGTTFWTISNPNLTCIEVDDVAYSNANWGPIDAWASFSSNCGNACSANPCDADANFSYVNNGNGNYSFTNMSTGNYTDVRWAYGDGTTSLLSNPSHSFITNGNYTVVLAVTDSTQGSSCIDYHTINFTVNSVPVAPNCNGGFVIYPDTTANDFIVFNSSTGNNLTYWWDFGDSNFSNLQNPSHTYTTSGPFNLCLSIDDGSGCTDMYCDSIGPNGVVFKQAGFTIAVISPIITGISNQVKLSSEVGIYPNPTKGNITIDLGEIKTNLKVTLTNSLGQIILTQQFESTNQININIDDPKGIYFLTLDTTEGESKTVKVLKK